MCLVLAAWQNHPQYALVVAANRDEFYARPAQDLAWWDDAPQVLAGRDLGGGRMGGTWLGLGREGRFAALTNVREPNQNRANMRSRGKLAADFLSRPSADPRTYASEVAEKSSDYNGFNLLVSDFETLWWYSNRGGAREPLKLDAGFYGLSNAELDTPWPKVRDGVSDFAEVAAMDSGFDFSIDPYLAILRNEDHADRDSLPSTGVTVEVEALLSARFVQTPIYGTRCSTVLRVGHDGSFQMDERRYDQTGTTHDTQVQGIMRRSDALSAG